MARQAARPEGRQPARDALLYGALASAIAFLGIVAVIKATNEPAVSNTWQFYSLSEKAALTWGNEYIGQHSFWVGHDQRIPAAIMICCYDEFENLGLKTSFLQPDARDILISDVIRERAVRIGIPLPIQADSMLIYSNGNGDIYHLRPKTPFQK
jgi:hypothetical protein